LTGLLAPSDGEVLFDGHSIREPATRAAMRTRMSMVFQDPYDSLDPRMTLARIVAEPLAVHGVGTRGERRERAAALLASVGLGASDVGRRPTSLSGGQRQRVAIARALALEPDLIVFDEPVSGLDVSIQAQVLNLIADIHAERSLAYVLISHDLAVVREIADRVLVMYAGRIVETAPTDELFDSPRHPYTCALLSSALDLEDTGERIVLAGDPPDPRRLPSGCSFRERCFRAQPDCALREPELRDGEHRAACFHPVLRADEPVMTQDRTHCV
jgi:oligopeptide/dipeptide ABC transporter ATP-binding protein